MERGVKKHTDKAALCLYLLLYLIVAISLARVQPHNDIAPLYPNPPDEHSRYLIPRFICAHGVLPTGFEAEVQNPMYGFSYALQPGLPYIVMGYLCRLVARFSVDEWGLLLTARMANVFFGLCMAYLVYLIGGKIFRDASTKWLFCCGVAYLPEMVFLHSYVNTESMCQLSIAMMGYALICMYQDGLSRRNCLLLSMGQIICALTYYNAYGFLLMSAVVFLGAFFQKEEDGGWRFERERFLRFGVPTLICALVGAGWWFVRSAVLLNGDVFGLATTMRMQEAHGVVRESPLKDGLGLLEMFREKHTLRALCASFVAIYGSMTIAASEKFYWLYGAFLLCGAVPSVVGLARTWGTQPRRTKFFHACVWIATLITIALWLYYCYVSEYQPQGRYVMPIALPLFVFVTKGYEYLSGQCEDALAKSLPQIRTAARVVRYAMALCLCAALAHFVFRVAYPVYLQYAQMRTV